MPQTQAQRSWDPPPPWVYVAPGGMGWSRKALEGAPPIETITPPHLWGDWPPAPPQIDRHPPAAEPNHLVGPSPLTGGPMAGIYMQWTQRSRIEERPPKLPIQHPVMPVIEPNDRHPVTGAPIRNPAVPPGTPLPPGQVGIMADGQHPITGAPIRGPGGGTPTGRGPLGAPVSESGAAPDAQHPITGAPTRGPGGGAPPPFARTTDAPSVARTGGRGVPRQAAPAPTPTPEPAPAAAPQPTPRPPPAPGRGRRR